jgi:hypothetical protein
MVRNDPLSFYGKDRHVHGCCVAYVAARMRRRPGASHPVEEQSLRWLKIYHRSISIASFQDANRPETAHQRAKALLL